MGLWAIIRHSFERNLICALAQGCHTTGAQGQGHGRLCPIKASMSWWGFEPTTMCIRVTQLNHYTNYLDPFMLDFELLVTLIEQKSCNFTIDCHAETSLVTLYLYYVIILQCYSLMSSDSVYFFIKMRLIYQTNFQIQHNYG